MSSDQTTRKVLRDFRMNPHAPVMTLTQNALAETIGGVLRRAFGGDAAQARPDGEPTRGRRDALDAAPLPMAGPPQ